MRRIELDPSLRLAWIIANNEAHYSGCSSIEPIHFLLAILKIIDGGYLQFSKHLGYSAEIVAALKQKIAEAQRMLSMKDEEITRIRRSLRKTARKDEHPTAMNVLHRSERSRNLFAGAAACAMERGLSAIDILLILERLLQQLPAEALPYFQSVSQDHTAETVRNFGSFIDSIGVDLTALALAGRLTPVVGRKREMTTLARY